MISIVFVWKPRNLLVKIAMLISLIYMAYAMTRFFVDEILVLNPAGAVIHGILTFFGLVVLFYLVGSSFKFLFSKRFIGKLKRLRTDQVISVIIIGVVVVLSLVFWLFLGVANAFPVLFIIGVLSGLIIVVLGLVFKFKSKKYNVFALITMAWLSLACWSYFGFSQRYTIVDPHQEEFSYAFWGSPSGGLSYYYDTIHNLTWYNKTEMNEELALFSQLNATFYNTISITTLSNPATLANFALTLKEWEKYGLRFIFDITPLNNDTGTLQGDFVSYYYLNQMNETIRALMDWLEPLNLSNFRGISFDVEAPKYSANQPISREQYKKAIISYQGILDEFKSRFPSSQVHLIQMEGIMFDFYDNDHDLDISLRTVSVELNWDWFGFMTYHVSPSPSTSSYRYAYFLQAGKEQFGEKFQPWVGWWYEDGDIDLPGVYEQSLEHVKIAKSTGVREVVLAPVRNFIGQDHNHTKIMSRLNALLDIKEKGFDTFSIPINHDMRLLNDWDYYWKKIVPSYLISNNDVLKDLLIGTGGNWFAVIQVIQAVGIILFSLYIYDKKH
ncbi:MAG: hypothetical protein ACTSYS_17570 [Promethearchaeota archaeon]